MIRVKKIFDTIQGEGYHAGRAATFVRLVGCNLWTGFDKDRGMSARIQNAKCPMWCDTDFTKKGSTSMTPAALVERLKNKAFVVFTGGEPAMQLSKHPSIIGELRAAGVYVTIETNGTIPAWWTKADERPNWITVSPKVGIAELSLREFDELKLVLPDFHPSAYWVYAGLCPGAQLYVQPEDGPRYNSSCAACVEWVVFNPEWRVSAQIHKILGAE